MSRIDDECRSGFDIMEVDFHKWRKKMFVDLKLEGQHVQCETLNSKGWPVSHVV